MTRHKFQIGQLVDFAPGRMGFPASSRQCKILRLLPIEDGQPQYRVQCPTETFERVAKESALSPRA